MHVCSIDRVRNEVISDDNDEVEEIDIQYNGTVVETVQLSKKKHVMDDAQPKDMTDPPPDLLVKSSNEMAMDVDRTSGSTALSDAERAKEKIKK